MTAWKYETAQDLERPFIDRLRQFPREPDMLMFGLRSLAALTIRAWLRIYHRFTVTGEEHLPQTGSYILIANHASHLDALCLTAALPLRKLHRVFPAAAADYFFESVPRTWIAAVVVNALPFARQLHIRQSLRLCEQLLANSGNVLIIFPEGTRTGTGELGKFKPGVGMLLAGRDLPVIPCYIDGTFRAWGKNVLVPRPARIRVRIGTPRNYAQLAPGLESARIIAAELQSAVQEIASSNNWE